ncbi:MAG: DUF4405 domain-containing protein [Deltaproteobacteria bacterium]|nr:DUF4405 domain-containing protein [Deltaproteobacteria bacterium]
MKKVNWQYLIDALLFISIVGVVIIGFLLAFIIPRGPTATDNAKYFLGLHRHEWGDIHLYLGIAFTSLAVVHLILAWKWVKGKTRGLFGDRWKAALLSMCGLAFVVLAAFWLAYPSELGDYDHDETRATLPASRDLWMDHRPKYSPGSASQTASADFERNTPEHVSYEFQPITKNAEEYGAVNHRRDAEAGLTRGRGSEDKPGILITGQMTFYDIERQTGISARVLANYLGLPRNVSLGERLGRLRKKYRFSMQEFRDVLSSLVERKSALSDEE